MDDLISRKAAITKVEKARKAARTLTGMDFVMMLKDQPAVDAAPHGRWEERRVDYLEETTIDAWQSAKCTNCGKYHTTPYLYYFTDYKFCPNCGAKMDGERRDEDADN